MIEQKQIMKLNISEKIQLMELLWDEISRDDDNLEIPEWHKQILDSRMTKNEGDNSHYEDWNSAKADILKKIQ